MTSRRGGGRLTVDASHSRCVLAITRGLRVRRVLPRIHLFVTGAQHGVTTTRDWHVAEERPLLRHAAVEDRWTVFRVTGEDA
jgi:hypothetical protein